MVGGSVLSAGLNRAQKRKVEGCDQTRNKPKTQGSAAHTAPEMQNGSGAHRGLLGSVRAQWGRVREFPLAVLGRCPGLPHTWVFSVCV